jgi:hypothetical protein
MANKHLLLVEGKDDEHVFYHLLEHYHVPEQFKIKDKEGVDNLLDTLDVEIEGSGLECLGIVVDADMSIESRWQALRGILMHCGYDNVPTHPLSEGVIVEQEGRPKIGVWIMPDNTLPGMLEHFIGFLVPPGDTLWPRAGECVAQIPEPERRFPQEHQSKAHVHTWLAWQEEPGTPMGQAITKRYLDAEAEHARRLIGWVRRLFDV